MRTALELCQKLRNLIETNSKIEDAPIVVRVGEDAFQIAQGVVWDATCKVAYIDARSEAVTYNGIFHGWRAR